MSGAGFMVAFPCAVNSSGRTVEGGRFVPRLGLVGRPWVDRPGLAARFRTVAAAAAVADRMNGGSRLSDRFGRRWCVVGADGGCPVVLVDCDVPAGRTFRRTLGGGVPLCAVARSGRGDFTIGDVFPAL